MSSVFYSCNSTLMKLTKSYKIQSWIFKKIFQNHKCLVLIVEQPASGSRIQPFLQLRYQILLPRRSSTTLATPFFSVDVITGPNPANPPRGNFPAWFWKQQWARSNHNNHGRRHQLHRYELGCASSPLCWAQGWVTRAWLSRLLFPNRCRKAENEVSGLTSHL